MTYRKREVRGLVHVVAVVAIYIALALTLA